LKEDRKKVAANLCKADQSVRAYVVVGYRHSGNDGDSVARILKFPFHKDESRIQIEAAEITYVRRIGALELGETFAANFFHGRDFQSFARFSATPAVGFSPFAVVSDGPRAHNLTFWIGGTTFFGGFDGSDFCPSKPAKQPSCEGVAPFHTRTEVVPRVWVVWNPSLALK